MKSTTACRRVLRESHSLSAPAPFVFSFGGSSSLRMPTLLHNLSYWHVGSGGSNIYGWGECSELWASVLMYTRIVGGESVSRAPTAERAKEPPDKKRPTLNCPRSTARDESFFLLSST